MPRRKGRQNELRVVLHFQGERREVFLFAEENGNFYVILPDGPMSVNWHVSYHASGQRHFKAGSKGKPLQKFFVSRRQPTSAFKGTELIVGGSIVYGQFQNLRVYNPSRGPAIVLDAETAHFRDDIIFVRVFLIEPRLEPEIPSAVNVGPKLVHVVKSTNPWVGIAFFQEKAP